jgi:hypothetical protein
MSLDDRSHAVEVPRQQETEGFRVESLAQLRGAGDVAEQDCHDLALFARDIVRADPGAAGVAEPGIRRVFVPTRGAAAHSKSLRLAAHSVVGS